jgi:hypothetical protein
MPRNVKSKRFANQAEEAAWWRAREDSLADEFEKAIADGRVCPATLVITGDTTVTKVRLSAKDVALARTQAKQRELRCHDYLKSLLHQALCNTEEKEDSTSK